MVNLLRYQNIHVKFEHFSLSEPMKNHEIRRSIEKNLIEAREFFGICNIAGTYTKFSIQHDNIRETVLSAETGSFNRQRQLICGLSYALLKTPTATLEEIASVINKNRLTIYTTEANGAFLLHLQKYVDPTLLYSSEYFGPNYQSGEFVNGIRHEDLQQTSFADNSFDIILSTEVFEHIPDAVKAEKEIIRILKPGGVYCFTVPIGLTMPHDKIHAELNADGSITHHFPPEYHGDPVRAEGILVFRIFSHKELEERFTNAGCTFDTWILWSQILGILGDGIVHIVRKPSEQARASIDLLQSQLASVQKVSDSNGAIVNDQWLASLLADLVEHFISRNLIEEYRDYWKSRGFNIDSDF